MNKEKIENYGGIYTDRPFEANPKCLALAAAAVIAYWYLPQNSIIMAIVIFIAVYILIAWYDWAYECSVQLKSGKYGPQSIADSIFKPFSLNNPNIPAMQATDQNWLPEDEQLVIRQRNIWLFHAAVVAPALLYLGFYGSESGRGAFILAGSLGAFAGVYHGFQFAHYLNN